MEITLPIVLSNPIRKSIAAKTQPLGAMTGTSMSSTVAVSVNSIVGTSPNRF